jgi:predicted phosphodiesterase
MKIAIFSDIHGNLEALEAVLADLITKGCQGQFCCGDIVGYGANPAECVELVRKHKIPCVKGNHDDAAAVDYSLCNFNPDAAHAIDWTRSALSEADREWLGALPYQREYPDKGFTICHANLHAPAGWEYLFERNSAAKTLNMQTTPVVFLGHTHWPTAYVQDVNGRLLQTAGARVYIQRTFRYVINVGSVGQPRDKNPQASYVIYDTDERKVSFIRVDYAIAKAQAKIRQAKLPEKLATRIATGS